MKSILIGATLLAATAGFAGEMNFLGQFSSPHKTFIFGYDNAKACEADKGEWLAEDQICTFDVADEVKVEQSSNGDIKLSVETIGGNAHSCSFESQASFNEGLQLVGSAETEIYRYNEETKQDEWIKATCEVTVSYEDENTVSVSNNGKCQEFCGMRATLDINEAKRVAPKAE